MSLFKTEAELASLREGGRRLGNILSEVGKAVRPGVTTGELDALARSLIEKSGDTAAFLGYQPWGASFPYPAALCVSVNNEVVHGIPGDEALKEGDIVSLDLGLVHEGLITDAAITLPVGNIDEDVAKLIDATREALKKGIAAIRPGAFIGDIGKAIEGYATPLGYGIVSELGGHGVGHAVHEEPYIPNIRTKGNGPKIKEGMVLAIEPMLNLGSPDVYLNKDGYTFKTRDGSWSAHFEHTVIVGGKGAEVITLPS